MWIVWYYGKCIPLFGCFWCGLSNICRANWLGKWVLWLNTKIRCCHALILSAGIKRWSCFNFNSWLFVWFYNVLNGMLYYKVSDNVYVQLSDLTIIIVWHFFIVLHVSSIHIWTYCNLLWLIVTWCLKYMMVLSDTCVWAIILNGYIRLYICLMKYFCCIWYLIDTLSDDAAFHSPCLLFLICASILSNSYMMYDIYDGFVWHVC